MDAPEDKEVSAQKAGNGKTIGFVGMNNVLVPFASRLQQKGIRTVIWNGHLHDRLVPGITQIRKAYGFFGLARLTHAYAPDISLPYYFSGLSADIAHEDPDALIVMDHIRLWFWQALRAKRRNPRMRLYLYTETKRAPANMLSRMVFPLFIRMLQRNAHLLERVFVYTEEGKSFMGRFVPQSLIQLMPVPIDENLFYAGPAARIDRAEAPATLHLLMNARYAAFKNHRDLMHALALLPTELLSAISVTCIGNDGGMKGTIEALVQELRLSSIVTFTEPVAYDGMRAVYVAHDALVLPSYNEAIGMVVPEAMACGLATITSDTVGANVYVKEGETGYIFPTGNIAALAETIRKMIEQGVAQHMGIAAARRMCEEFATDSLTTRFAEAIGA